MDLISLGFYAAVCGVLGAVSPLLGRFPVRFAIGVAVGLAAASLLPVLRAAMGAGY